MKILLTGSTGYIGRRLLPILVQNGHFVVCAVRDKRRFDWEDFSENFLENVEVIETDFTNGDCQKKLPLDIDIAYYLIHSLTQSYGNFSNEEENTAAHFANYVSASTAKQIIYLGGIANDHVLSKHLQSRKNVEDILKESNIPTTVLRAAIIIGSGSASFEIIRDLVEKLPIMIAPKWLKSRCQPIGIRNVVEYLNQVMNKKEAFDQTFDIGGPDILTYKEILLGFAKVRKLKRIILTVPVLTPKLSSLWLYFVTSIAYALARNLVDSMRHDVVVENKGISDIASLELYSYQDALSMAFSKINQKNVISSWKDAITHPSIKGDFLDFIEVPDHGCFHDVQTIEFKHELNDVKRNIWEIGGDRGWYFGSWMWNIRGFFDKLVGGVGLRRGRRSQNNLKAGDALDFWRVLLADEQEPRLLLYAEMKLPGEAWLEFRIKKSPSKQLLIQKATFRPLGLWGRLYWYLVLPFHFIIFPKMANNIVNYKTLNT